MIDQFISGDCHMDINWLPPDLFVSNAPLHLRELMPHVKETSQGKTWYIGTTPFAPFGGSGVLSSGGDSYVPGVSKRFDRMEEIGFFSDAIAGKFHPSTPELRLRDQEIDGVGSEVIYGILGLSTAYGSQYAWNNGSSPSSLSIELDPNNSEALATAYGIYNEWISEFCLNAPERFKGLACITGTSPVVASKQLRRAADLGLRGAELDVSSVIQPIYHKDWDMLWATAAECSMPITFHTIGMPFRQPNESDLETYRWVRSGLMYTMFQLSGAEFLTSIILSGACDRYPEFKFVLGECGVGWIPYVLHRMDEEYDNFSSQIGLSLKPSEYWARQGYTTFQDEALTKEVISIVGVDNIMWGSDYPHPDGIWPDSPRIIQRNLSHLDQSTLSKLVYGNTKKLYRILEPLLNATRK